MIEQKSRNKFRLIVSTKDDNGKRTRRTKTVECSGKREAQRLYAEFEKEIHAKRLNGYTVKDLIDAYIGRFEKNGGKETTIRAYRCASKPIISAIGERNAEELTLAQVERFISAETKIRSPKSIKNEVSLISSAYKYGIKAGIVTHNPCVDATIPKQIKPDIDTLNEETIHAFIRALDSTVIDFKVACELALFCGLRRSEILGLLKSDIKDGQVTISKVRHHINGVDIIQTPKTKTSTRVLTVPRFILDDIEILKKEHGKRARQSNFLIENLWGDPSSSYWVDKRMHELIEKNDLPHITMHGLRHTYTSMLINAGIPIAEVSSELGHSSIDITLRTYTHLFRDASTASKRISEHFEKSFSESWAHDRAHETKKKR